MVKTMKLDHDQILMSLSKDELKDNAINTVDQSSPEPMQVGEDDVLPPRVANVSREELRKYVQCKRVGNYLLGKTVGEGSFAKVKEALHILTGEKVAIKIIDKNRARKDRYVSKNMRREARLLQMIRHPHIVQLLEVVETTQCYYLVFEFADGGDLMDYICKRKKLDEEEVRKFIRQIISAVEYLHRLGIIHRDLKVENLLLDANHNIKIIDFGLSNTIFSPDPTNENHCSTQCGSPAYAAPELLVRKDYGPKVDVWSIGVNMYAMLTGRLPYTVEPFNISTLYNKMLRQQMNSVPEYLSEGCKEFIYQLLNPNPKERINLLEATRNRWVTYNQNDPLILITCPNYLREEDLEDNILDHVETRLKLNSDDVICDVIQNRATKNSSVYYLLLRRLNRYKREYENVRASIPRSPREKTNRATPTSPEPSTPGPKSPEGNTLRQDPWAKPKTHIIENPFKTIKVALIRHKKATKSSKSVKSKSVTFSEAPPNHTENDSSQASQLCPVKKVALVKVAPARRSFRGVLSSARNLNSSPVPGRRKSYFDGLQQRRKSPKVRRRNPDDDSRSSIGSNSLKNASFSKRSRDSLRRRSQGTSITELTLYEDKKSEKNIAEKKSFNSLLNNESQESPTVKSQETLPDPTMKPLVDSPHSTTRPQEISTQCTAKDAVHEQSSSEKSEAMETDAVHTSCENERIFEDTKETRGSKMTGEDREEPSKNRVSNAKIPSIANRRGVERLEPINPKSASTRSSTPGSGSSNSPSPRSNSPNYPGLTPNNLRLPSPQFSSPKPPSPQPRSPMKQTTSNDIHHDSCPSRKPSETLPSPRQATNKSLSPTRIPVPTTSLPNQRTAPNNDKTPKLTDSYTNRYSVVGADRSSEKVTPGGSGGTQSKKIEIKEESKEEQGKDIINTEEKQNCSLQPKANITTANKRQESGQTAKKENRWKTDIGGLSTKPSFPTRDWKKSDENLKNISRNGFLPNKTRPVSNQIIKAKDRFKQPQSSTGDEKNKPSWSRRNLADKTDESKRLSYSTKLNGTFRKQEFGTREETNKPGWANQKIKTNENSLTKADESRSSISSYVSAGTGKTRNETGKTSSTNQSKEDLIKPNEFISCGNETKEMKPNWATQTTRGPRKNMLADNDDNKGGSNDRNSKTGTRKPSWASSNNNSKNMNKAETVKTGKDLEMGKGNGDNNSIIRKESSGESGSTGHARKPSWTNRTGKSNITDRKSDSLTKDGINKPSWVNNTANKKSQSNAGEQTRKPSWAANKTVKRQENIGQVQRGVDTKTTVGRNNNNSKENEIGRKPSVTTTEQIKKPSWANRAVQPRETGNKSGGLVGSDTRSSVAKANNHEGKPSENINKRETVGQNTKPSWANKPTESRETENKSETLTGIGTRGNKPNENKSETVGSTRKPSWANKGGLVQENDKRPQTMISARKTSLGKLRQNETTTDQTRRPSWAKQTVKPQENDKGGKTLTGMARRTSCGTNNMTEDVDVDKDVDKTQNKTSDQTRKPSWAKQVVKPEENVKETKTVIGVGTRKVSVGNEEVKSKDLVKKNQTLGRTETAKPSWMTQRSKPREPVRRTQTWTSDDRRNISLYRKTSDSFQIYGRQEPRPLPTNNKPTCKSCS